MFFLLPNQTSVSFQIHKENTFWYTWHNFIEGGQDMKKLIMLLIVFMFTFGVAFASGDKNQGTTGQGTTSTGSTSQGSSTQSQTGR